MKQLIAALLISIPLVSLAAPSDDTLKPRIIVLTDISPNSIEPDDMESIIRLFAYADLFEIEGLVATTGWSSGGGNADWIDLIHQAIKAYEKDLPNLSKRSDQNKYLKDESRQRLGYWPSPEYLSARTVVGSQVRGIEHVGEGNNSPGSDLIIEMADQADQRPVWVLAWGGANTLAQAIWQVKNERSEDQFEAFLKKLRLYTITDQDRSHKSGTPYDISSHQWMRRAFKDDLFFIWDESAWRYQNGTGKRHWDEYAEHVQGHGALGGLYPKYKYGVEGDTPSFLYVLPNGLNSPERPGWGSWGGYFEWALGPDGETHALTNYSDTSASSVSRKYEQQFYPAIFNDFAARMDWVKNGSGNRNPVAVVDGDSGIEALTLSPKPGARVTLDASGSYDPDGDSLRVSWWLLPEAGSYRKSVQIRETKAATVVVDVPEDSAGQSFHVILEVVDEGEPSLTAYRRIIFKPVGSE